MEAPVLLYDAKCPICRNLALNVQFGARTPVEITALSDPAAATMLERFYPAGWKHDFYLIQNGSCRRGLRALPSLTGIVGPGRLGALIGEYTAYKLARTACSRKKDHKHTPQTAMRIPKQQRWRHAAKCSPPPSRHLFSRLCRNSPG